MDELSIMIAGEVVFDAAGIGTVNGPITSNIQYLTIPRGVATITVTLATQNGNSNVATFPSSAIVSPEPSPPLGVFDVLVANNGLSFTIVDSNTSAEAEGTFTFSIAVLFDGQTFTHDPVIVNEPPVPPE